MGIFGRKKISDEEKAFQEENRKRLEEFKVTKAWGVKKYQVATQFIYDEDMKAFVVVDGPEETFRDRNPYIIDFEQVKEVTLEVDEYWTENDEQYNPVRGMGILTMDKYDEVFWRYNFNLIIDTDHPYAGQIKYQMNFKTNIIKLPNRKLIFARRGLEIGGTYKGDEISELVLRMEKAVVDEAKNMYMDKVADIVTLNRPDTILGKLVEDGIKDIYLDRINNMTAHVKRADRIQKLLK